MTHDPADENDPAWSLDGSWIYFNSNRTGRSEVWRAAAAGGSEEQVTRAGGAMPAESADGRTLYYKRSMEDGPLLAREPERRRTSRSRLRALLRLLHRPSGAVRRRLPAARRGKLIRRAAPARRHEYGHEPGR